MIEFKKIMRLTKIKYLRPSQFVLIGDQLLVVFGLLSTLFVYYRLLAIHVFPLKTILYNSIIHVVLAIGGWIVFKINKKVIRFFTSKDYLNLILIIFLIHVFSVLIGYFLPKKLNLKTEIFIISFFITACYIIGSRLIISYLYFYYRKSQKFISQKKLLIYGAGELGVFLKKSIATHYQGEYKLVAFLDDDKQKIGRLIGGIQVYDAIINTVSLIQKNGITDIIFANKTISPLKKAAFLELVLPYNVKIREITSIQSFFNSNFSLDKLSNIDINDLMNRKPIQLFDEHVEAIVTNKIAMVTGAAGSIGSEIVRKLCEHKVESIVCVDFSESALYDIEQEIKRNHPTQKCFFIITDIRNVELLENLFIEYQPDYIYHAAAYKHVPLMEQFPWEAVQTNVFGTLNLIELALKHQTEKFVFISSDKAVNPTSVMGATKRLAEILIQSYSTSSEKTSFVITRFGNVLGSNGSVVPLFKKQIQHGGPVTVTHPEMIRYFMTISEACQLVLEASVMANGGEIYVFDMGEPVKIVELAKNMIRLAGYIPDVDMKIEFIGQRPGEKLYEEVFSKNELIRETHNEKIMISAEKGFHHSEAENIIKQLKTLEKSYEPELFRIVIKNLIPEYQYFMDTNNTFINFKAQKNISKYKFQK
jgi:FlaA1/EpsC-like NDP-sugar epimerase